MTRNPGHGHRLLGERGVAPTPTASRSRLGTTQKRGKRRPAVAPRRPPCCPPSGRTWTQEPKATPGPDPFLSPPPPPQHSRHALWRRLWNVLTELSTGQPQIPQRPGQPREQEGHALSRGLDTGAPQTHTAEASSRGRRPPGIIFSPGRASRASVSWCSFLRPPPRPPRRRGYSNHCQEKA